jgi:hypothetical protein
MAALTTFHFWKLKKEVTMGKGLILWLMGVPLSVIILIAVFTTWI